MDFSIVIYIRIRAKPKDIKIEDGYEYESVTGTEYYLRKQS